MDEKEKARFGQILLTKFNNNLKDLNDVLEKYFQSIEYKKQFNKLMYEKNKENDEFKQKRKEYDKQYYQQNKDKLLKERKERYHNDNEFKEQIKLKQKNRYSQLNNLKNLKPTSSGSISGSNIE